MFLSCGGGNTSTSSVCHVCVNNNYINLPTWITNFKLYPQVSDHFNITSTQPITQVGANITSTGVITFTFNENVVFVSATVAALMGSNSIVFKDSTNTVVKTVTFSSTTASDTILFRSVDITLDMGTQLVNFSWQSAMNYHERTFNDAVNTTLFSLYPMTINGAIATGTQIIPSGAGPITIIFAHPTIIYNVTFTGTIKLYVGAVEVYEAVGVLAYYDPVTSITIDTSLTSIGTLIMSNPAAALTYTSVSCTTESHYFSLSGATLTFYEPTFINGFTQSGSGAIVINGVTYNNTHSFADYGLISTISGGTLSTISVAQREHHEESIGGFTSLDFSTYTAGTIVIETDYYLIQSADQLNKPAMISTSPSGFGVLCSQDTNSLVPSGGAGTINITFKQPTYLASLTFDATIAGTVIVGGKTYTISTTVSPRDWINAGCMLTTAITINITAGTGRLTGMSISTVLPSYYERDSSNYITEDFETQTVEFSCMAFDTNIATALGTPNSAYGGPGIGVGGGPGNGANTTYLGHATQSNITFDQSRWIRSITLINSLFNYSLSFYDATPSLIATTYTGNFGANSIVTIAVNKKVKSVVITGNMAIAAITYSATPRYVVGLLDNAVTPVAFATSTSGNYILTISGLTGTATAIATATKSSSAVAGTLWAQSNAATTGESVAISWPIGTQIQLYHNTIRSGGTGATLWYVIRVIN